MRSVQTSLIIFAIFLSYAPVQSQTTAGRAQILEEFATPHLKILLKDEYDIRGGFNLNLLKVPLSIIVQSEDLVLKEIVGQDITSGNWVNSSKESFTYNSQIMLKDWTISDWNDSEWNDLLRFSFEYNSSGLINKVLFTVWENNEWQNVTINLLTYDMDNNITDQLIQFWDDTDWANLSRIGNTFSETNLIDVALFQNWPTDSWVNDYQLLYSYVDATDTLDTIIRQEWIEDEWNNDLLDNYTFHSHGELIEIEFSVYNSSGQSWQKLERDLWIYGGPDFLLGTRTDKWVEPEAAPGFWKDSLRTTWVMNSIGTVFWGVNQIFVNGEWINDTQITELSNDFLGYLLDITYAIWEMNSWVNTSRSVYSYRSVVSVDNEGFIAENYHLAQNFPNPFNPLTLIEYSLPKAGEMTLTIYNLRGELVARLIEGVKPSGDNSVTWDASNVSSGIYFYRLQAGDFVQTKKMVLLK